jgi:hypothetical protein
MQKSLVDFRQAWKKPPGLCAMPSKSKGAQGVQWKLRGGIVTYDLRSKPKVFTKYWWRNQLLQWARMKAGRYYLGWFAASSWSVPGIMLGDVVSSSLNSLDPTEGRSILLLSYPTFTPTSQRYSSVASRILAFPMNSPEKWDSYFEISIHATATEVLGGGGFLIKDVFSCSTTNQALQGLTGRHWPRGLIQLPPSSMPCNDERDALSVGSLICFILLHGY